MADPKMQPCPKCKGTAVKIFPSWGGSGGNLTAYVAECPCGMKVDHLSRDGTKRGAIRDWNRWAKEQRRTAGVAGTPAPGDDPLESQAFYEVCQQYRRAQDIVARPGQLTAAQAFDALKSWLRAHGVGADCGESLSRESPMPD